jgi:hypothetical protein
MERELCGIYMSVPFVVNFVLRIIVERGVNVETGLRDMGILAPPAKIVHGMNLQISLKVVCRYR